MQINKVSIIATLLLVLSFHSIAQSDEIRIAEANLAISKSDCETAIIILAECSEREKEKPEFLYPYAEAWNCLGRYDSAIKYYGNLSSIYPNASATKIITKDSLKAKIVTCYYCQDRSIKIKAGQEKALEAGKEKGTKQNAKDKNKFVKTPDYYTGAYEIVVNNKGDDAIKNILISRQGDSLKLNITLINEKLQFSNILPHNVDTPKKVSMPLQLFFDSAKNRYYYKGNWKKSKQSKCGIRIEMYKIDFGKKYFDDPLCLNVKIVGCGSGKTDGYEFTFKLKKE